MYLYPHLLYNNEPSDNNWGGYRILERKMHQAILGP